MSEPVSPVLILGARSDIGKALARAYASAGCAVILAARRAKELDDDRRDIELRFKVSATTAEFDVTAPDPDTFFRNLSEAPGTVIMVAGLLGDQADSAAQDEAAGRVFETNFNGPSRYLLAAARSMKGKVGATLVGISSVAGDRGRGSNFVYGSAKAGFSAFLSGLRNSLAHDGIHVLTVKPGFVDTQMTAGMNLPKPLTAQPDEVAEAILKAHRRNANEIYVRPVWRLVMAVIKAIPEPIFKKLKL